MQNELQNPIESPDWRVERLAKIKALYPDLFTDEGTISIDEIHALAHDYDLSLGEKFEFKWPGKMQAKKNAFTSSKARLAPDVDRSVNFEETNNVIIEGENLEVLKLLSKAYYNKVKCIYIDPPYNTGHDFVYSDDYSEGRQAYWEKNGVFHDGLKVDTNSESAGRYHTNWLNMMMPRLLLAQMMLRDDGVIFVSIDDNEVHNLRKLMDEVFGSENFITQFVWSGGRKNDSRFVSVSHEYIVCYVKNAAALKEQDVTWRQKKKGLEGIYKAYEKLKKKYTNDFRAIESGLAKWYSELDNTDPAKNHSHYNKVDEWGIYFAADISWPGGGGPTYVVLHPVTKKPCKVPSRGWMFGAPEKMAEAIADDRVHFGVDEASVPCIKAYLSDRETSVPYSVFYQDGRAATKRLRELLGGDYFDHPKDELVLRDVFEFCTRDNDLVVDFFAGSGTTGHAIMALNEEDGGNRRFVLVQIPEATDEKSEAYKAGYKKISEITIERVKRAGERIDAEKPEADTGFKVFKLTTSIFPENTYQPDPEKSAEENVQALKDHIARAKQQLMFDPKGKETDLMYETLVKQGFMLTMTKEYLGEFGENDVWRVTDGDRNAIVCLDADLKDATVKALAKYKNNRFIGLHRAADTTKKWELTQAFGEALVLI